MHQNLTENALPTTSDFVGDYLQEDWGIENLLQPLRLPRLADNVGALWPTNNNSYMHACWPSQVDFFGRLHFGP